MHEELYATAFSKKIYNSIEELQADVDIWLQYYNNKRPQSGKYCFGKTSIRTWRGSVHLAKEKLLDTLDEDLISLKSSGKVKACSAGEQPISNNPIGWNCLDGENAPSFPLIIPGMKN